MTMRTSFDEVPFFKEESRRFVPWIMGMCLFILMILTFLAASVSCRFGHLENASHRFIVETSKDTQESTLKHLKNLAYVKTVKLLDQDQIYHLLSYWIQDSELLSDLPLPMLIDVELQDSEQVDLTKLETELKKIDPESHIDAYTRWDKRLSDFSRSIHWVVGLFVTALFVLMTLLMALFSKSSLYFHQSLLDTLRLLGVRQRTIALQFQWQSLFMSLTGALAAFLMTVPVLYLVLIHFKRLNFPVLFEPIVTSKTVFWTLILPLFACIFCSFISRWTVLRYLSRLER